MKMIKRKKIRKEEDLHVETDYKIIHDDACFLVVEKPAPLPVHPVGRFTQKNLLSLLQKDRPEEAAGFRICNRLDSETSGLLIVAKSSEMAGKIGIIFEKRQVKKEYLAVVSGHPKPAKGTISIRLGTVHRGPLHMRKPDAKGETAITNYETLKTGVKHSLLRVLPETGRKHQIRAHLAFKGHPILGDKIYINTKIFERYMNVGWLPDMLATVKSDRLLLHASKLSFKHPETGSRVVFSSEPPALFHSFIS